MNNFTICWYNKVSNDTEFFRWKAFDEWEVDFVPEPENFPLKRFKFHLAHRKIVEQSKVIQCYVGVLKWNSWGKMPLLGSAPKSRECARWIWIFAYECHRLKKIPLEATELRAHLRRLAVLKLSGQFAARLCGKLSNFAHNEHTHIRVWRLCDSHSVRIQCLTACNSFELYNSFESCCSIIEPHWNRHSTELKMRNWSNLMHATAEIGSISFN